MSSEIVWQWWWPKLGWGGLHNDEEHNEERWWSKWQWLILMMTVTWLGEMSEGDSCTGYNNVRDSNEAIWLMAMVLDGLTGKGRNPTLSHERWEQPCDEYEQSPDSCEQSGDKVWAVRHRCEQSGTSVSSQAQLWAVQWLAVSSHLMKCEQSGDICEQSDDFCEQSGDVCEQSYDPGTALWLAVSSHMMGSLPKLPESIYIGPKKNRCQQHKWDADRSIWVTVTI